MRIDNVNRGFGQNLNFKRVIPLNCKQTPNSAPVKGIDPALAEISDILNSIEPFAYSKEETDKIREFFRMKIEDYNGKNGVMITKAGDKTFLVTGEDTKEIRALRKQTAERVKEISNSEKSNKQKNIEIRRARNDLASEILTKAENGNFKKPDSGFIFNRKDTKKLHFDSISYYYRYFNTSKPEKYYHMPSERTLTAQRTAIYDEGKLEL